MERRRNAGGFDAGKKRRRVQDEIAEVGDTSRNDQVKRATNDENAQLREELQASQNTLKAVASECLCGICMEVFDQPCAYVYVM